MNSISIISIFDSIINSEGAKNEDWFSLLDQLKYNKQK